jgi:hypothetical protein
MGFLKPSLQDCQEDSIDDRQQSIFLIQHCSNFHFAFGRNDCVGGFSAPHQRRSQS